MSQRQVHRGLWVPRGNLTTVTGMEATRSMSRQTAEGSHPKGSTLFSQVQNQSRKQTLLKETLQENTSLFPEGEPLRTLKKKFTQQTQSELLCDFSSHCQLWLELSAPLGIGRLLYNAASDCQTLAKTPCSPGRRRSAERQQPMARAGTECLACWLLEDNNERKQTGHGP